MRRVVLMFSSLPLVLLITFGGGGASGAAKTAGLSTNSSGHSRMPVVPRKTIRAIRLPSAPNGSTTNLQPPGVLVPKADIVATAGNGQQVLFGLAVFDAFMEATYPAISTDSGATWLIDGPRFYVAAAQGPDLTDSLGTLSDRGAYFWGHGGDVVNVTTDEGVHWWATGFGFGAGVYKVSGRGHTLHTVALGEQLKGGSSFQAFLYVSTNSGRTWRLHGKLRNVRL